MTVLHCWSWLGLIDDARGSDHSVAVRSQREEQDGLGFIRLVTEECSGGQQLPGTYYVILLNSLCRLCAFSMRLRWC